MKKKILPGIILDSKVIETRQGFVEYDIIPGNGPAVLVSHGGLGGVDAGILMSLWLKPLDCRIISLSRPGYLDTPLSSGKSPQEQADLFVALMDELKIEKALLLSASAGGPPAYWAAIQHPKRFWGHIAVDSVSGYYDLPASLDPISEWLFTSNTGQKLIKYTAKKWPQSFLKQIFSSTAIYDKKQMKAHISESLSIPQARQFMTAFVGTMNPYKPREIGTFNDVNFYKEQSWLPFEKITIPTLVIHGMLDGDVKFGNGVKAYESIPYAEKIWLDEGGHLGFWLDRAGLDAQEKARNWLLKTFEAQENLK
jgi:pimeloyl-ACP methyl ester carboxylesterase